MYTYLYYPHYPEVAMAAIFRIKFLSTPLLCSCVRSTVTLFAGLQTRKTQNSKPHSKFGEKEKLKNVYM